VNPVRVDLTRLEVETLLFDRELRITLPNGNELDLRLDKFFTAHEVEGMMSMWLGEGI
jgi:hypothetical protein